ncbi:uncharacterized protein LOC108092829 [Drosophila ficusphila]|uniref:uncharacterized protein LOC108092829 n=1 Tax=Drosophila ficusphila TaxID=30025 RepID=UPI0007E76DEB|nr:uncharacterized protein LOC108092829 [Drosophila ficusphila]
MESNMPVKKQKPSPKLLAHRISTKVLLPTVCDILQEQKAADYLAIRDQLKIKLGLGSDCHIRQPLLRTLKKGLFQEKFKVRNGKFRLLQEKPNIEEKSNQSVTLVKKENFKRPTCSAAKKNTSKLMPKKNISKSKKLIQKRVMKKSVWTITKTSKRRNRDRYDMVIINLTIPNGEES